MVVRNKDDLVFCCKKNVNSNENYFYIVKEGYCFYTDSYILNNYEKFHKATLEFQNLSFEKFNDCAVALKFGIDQKGEYEEFKRTGLLNINDPNSYQDFLIYKRGKFSNRREYDEAKKLNISTRKELIDFTESGFESYKAFLDAKNLGFKLKSEYYESKKIGFERYDEYQEFLKSGCKTKDDFEFFKEKLPILIKKIETTIHQTLKDADNAFKSNRLEEFIRLKFLSIEKLTEVLYLKLFKKDLKYENDMKVDDFIDEIEKELNTKIVDPEELKYWRRIRNKVIHQNLKIKLDKTEKAKEFFDEIYGKLDEIYKQI